MPRIIRQVQEKRTPIELINDRLFKVKRRFSVLNFYRHEVKIGITIIRSLKFIIRMPLIPQSTPMFTLSINIIFRTTRINLVSLGIVKDVDFVVFFRHLS